MTISGECDDVDIDSEVGTLLCVEGEGGGEIDMGVDSRRPSSRSSTNISPPVGCRWGWRELVWVWPWDLLRDLEEEDDDGDNGRPEKSDLCGIECQCMIRR